MASAGSAAEPRAPTSTWVRTFYDKSYDLLNEAAVTELLRQEGGRIEQWAGVSGQVDSDELFTSCAFSRFLPADVDQLERLLKGTLSRAFSDFLPSHIQQLEELLKTPSPGLEQGNLRGRISAAITENMLTQSEFSFEETQEVKKFLAAAARDRSLRTLLRRGTTVYLWRLKKILKCTTDLEYKNERLHQRVLEKIKASAMGDTRFTPLEIEEIKQFLEAQDASCLSEKVVVLTAGEYKREARKEIAYLFQCFHRRYVENAKEHRLPGGLRRAVKSEESESGAEGIMQRAIGEYSLYELPEQNEKEFSLGRALPVTDLTLGDDRESTALARGARGAQEYSMHKINGRIKLLKASPVLRAILLTQDLFYCIEQDRLLSSRWLGAGA